MSVTMTDYEVPDAVRNKQHTWFQSAVRNTQNNEVRGMEGVYCCFLHKEKCRVPRFETAGAIWAHIAA